MSIRSLYYGAFALQWIALLSVYSIKGLNWLIGGGIAGGIIIAISLFIGSQGRHNRQNETLTITVMTATLALALLLWPVLGIDQAIFYVLVGMLIAANLSLTTRRNLYFTFLGSLFIVLFAASRSYSNLFTIWITLYVLAGVFTLMLAHTDARLEASLGDDGNKSHISWPAIFIVSICLLLGSGLVYLLFPRLPPVQLSAFPSNGGADFDDHPDSGHSGDEKKPEGAAPGDGGLKSMPIAGDTTGGNQREPPQPYDISRQRCLDRSLMFYLQADRKLYIRTLVYDDFDGTFWRSGSPEEIAIYRPQRRFVFEGAPSRNDGELVDQYYIIQKYDDAILPTSLRPTRISFPGNTLFLNQERVVSAIRPLQNGTSYTVKSYHLEIMDHIADGSDDHNLDRPRYLQIPSLITTRTGQLAESITTGARNNLARAILVESYLRENYPYTLSTYGRQPEAGLVEWFLFEQQKGHCELFASAMIIMLRHLEIPARFVTGYVSGRPNPITGFQELRNPGHAWIEAWIAPYGWITFDPTADWGDIEFRESPLLIISLTRYLEEKIRQIDQDGDGKGNSKSIINILILFLKIIWAAIMAILTSLLAAGAWVLRWFLAKGLWLLAVMAFGFVALYTFRPWLGGRLSILRLKLCRNQPANKRILLSWYETEQSFGRVGHPRQNSETPHEYQERISSLFPELHAETALLCNSFQWARYGNKSLTPDDAEQAASSASRLIRTTMHPFLPGRLGEIFRISHQISKSND